MKQPHIVQRNAAGHLKDLPPHGCGDVLGTMGLSCNPT